MKKILGILAFALFVVITGASCRTKANCDAYTGLTDQEYQSEKIGR